MRMNQAVARLRKARLLEAESFGDTTALSAHPLVRQHFAEKLRWDRGPILIAFWRWLRRRLFPGSARQGGSPAWRSGHRRMFNYLTATAEEHPATIAGLAPLYAAITHGCNAGLYREALHVLEHRVDRGNLFFGVNILGAIGNDLAARGNFFERSNGKVSWNRVVTPLAGEGSFIHGTGLALAHSGRFKDTQLGNLSEAMEAGERAIAFAIKMELAKMKTAKKRRGRCSLTLFIKPADRRTPHDCSRRPNPYKSPRRDNVYIRTRAICIVNFFLLKRPSRKSSSGVRRRWPCP